MVRHGAFVTGIQLTSMAWQGAVRCIVSRVSKNKYISREEKGSKSPPARKKHPFLYGEEQIGSTHPCPLESIVGGGGRVVKYVDQIEVQGT